MGSLIIAIVSDLFLPCCLLILIYYLYIKPLKIRIMNLEQKLNEFIKKNESR